MDVSVIMTVKNEGRSLRRLFDSLLNQSRGPEEVVVCDGGSTDETTTILEQYQDLLAMKVIMAPGTNISQGRNLAISAATGPIIASTDAGVLLDKDWLQELVRPIEDGRASMVAGWFEADPYSDFEVVMGATVLPALSDINPQKFLPSSRSIAFMKNEWEAVGGYPEWLDYSEDLVFDLQLFKKNGPFFFAPKALVYFRPRSSMAAFADQYYRYAHGDGRANLWPKRHAVRYFTYIFLLPFLGWSIFKGKWYGWIFLLLGLGSYCRRPAQRLWPMTVGWTAAARFRAFLLIPVIRMVGDIAKMVGYPSGVLWRLRHRNEERRG